ncbi:MAG TPA: CapA family protein [Burkholderiales bacterium]|nr:CapA family protein [Burkholderiales bacterium]
MTAANVVLYGVGDVGPIHEPMDKYSTLVRETLASGDIRFAQCERLYSRRGALQLHSGVSERPLEPHMASVFADCGFNVVSLASNHGMDWGPDALLDTLAVFRDMGIPTVGAGRDIEEARTPVVMNCNGTRVALLAYCSILPHGYEAARDKPGVAPLRVHTYYEAVETQPGMPPRVVTVPYEEDLEAMTSDIAAAKKNADVVVVSLHWGLHFIPRTIAEYQPIAARAAFGAGADLILGHHAHVPKAIGVHGGKACFYSLGNFIMSTNIMSRWMKRANTTSVEKAGAAFCKRYGVTLDPDHPLPYGTDGKRSLIVKALLAPDGVKKVSFLPALIDKQLRPEILKHGDPRFDDAIRFMDWASEEFDHRFEIVGDEVVVSGAGGDA